MKKTLSIVALFFVLILFGSWGFLAHKTIHQIATYSLPKKVRGFFFQNMDYMVYNSVRPDVRRKDDKTEDTKHYIDIDAPVFADGIPEDWTAAKAKYSEDTLRKYGTVCWEIMFLKEKLTRAFQNKQKDSILFYAADVGHYIADAHVPLHTTINYDGQMTGQKGIHALWESVIPEIHINEYMLFQDHKAKYLKNPQQEIWKAFRISNEMLKTVLEEEKNASADFTDKTKYKRSERFGKMRQDYTGDFAKAYAKRLGNTVNERLLESSRFVANFWYTCWVDAGKPDLSTITELSDIEKDKLKLETKAWKANDLIKNNLLQAKKTKGKDVE